jgi:porphobilinogen deaminase
MLTIGVFMNTWAKSYAFLAQQELIKTINAETNIAYFYHEKELNQALLSGAVQMVCQPLAKLPTVLPQGINIAALAERASVTTNLLIHLKAVAPDNVLFLKENACISANSAIEKAQLLAIRADLQISIKQQTPLDKLQDVQTNLFDACLIPTSMNCAFDFDETEFKKVSLSPKELVTQAGCGTAAYLTAEDDLTTRRLLKKLHHPSVSMATNVERQVKKLFNDTDIAAYCQIDAQKNYHLWAAALIEGKLCKTRLSQSTHLGLAERCKEMLCSL